MHECEVEVALSGQRVAAVGHRYLLHCNFKSGGRERLDKDVCRTAYSFQRGGSLRCDRVDERQSCLVRAEQGANDATAVAPDNRDRGANYFSRRLVARDRGEGAIFIQERLEGPLPVQAGRFLVNRGDRVDAGRYGADGDGSLPVRNRAGAIEQTSRRWRGD